MLALSKAAPAARRPSEEASRKPAKLALSRCDGLDMDYLLLKLGRKTPSLARDPTQKLPHPRALYADALACHARLARIWAMAARSHPKVARASAPIEICRLVVLRFRAATSCRLTNKFV